MIDNYKDLPIGDYLELCRVCAMDGVDELDKQVQVLAILSGCAPEEIGRLPLAEYTARVAKADFLQRECEVKGARIAKEYHVGGWVLVPTIKGRDLTASQYIDFQTYNKQGESKVVEMLSCFLVPKGKRYAEGYDVAELQDAMRKEMSVYDVLSVMAFFLALLRKSIADIRLFLDKELRTMPEEQRAQLMTAVMEKRSKK